MDRLFVIIPAAGKGERMGPKSNKLFMEVKGMSVIARTLQAFKDFDISLPDTELIGIVVTNKENIEPIRELVNEGGFGFVKSVIEGGATRGGSVYNGVLEALTLGASPEDKAFVHDGARCLVSLKVLRDCYDMLDTAEACVTGVPAKNTLKRVHDGYVVDTPPRSELFEVQTPQCFRYGVLKESYDKAMRENIKATDDTALAENAGYRVRIVEGSYANIKITTPEDITLAESLADQGKN